MNEPEDRQSDGGELSLPFVTTALTAAVNTKPGTALFLPSATVLGNYFGEQTTEWVAKRKALKSRNLLHHRDKVLRLDPPDLDTDGPTERQYAHADEWAKGAEKIDPERDKELSALWEGLLSEIYRDGDDIAEMMAALHGMDRRDAKLLLAGTKRWSRTASDNQRRGYARLEAIGVAESYSALRQAGETRVQSLAILGIFSVATAFLLPNLLSELPFGESVRTDIARYQTMVWFAVASCAALLTFAYTRFWGSFRLTDLGLRLQASARRFLDRD